MDYRKEQVKEYTKSFLSGVASVCAATNCEMYYLWKEYHNRFDWKSNGMGLFLVIGELSDMPITISCWTAIIGEKKILFYESPSQVTDYRQVRKWLIENVDCLKDEDNFSRVHTDANNFANILPD